ncbi:MAG: T9SS type A sorting domain-containing protein [Bacteroidia bacterium]
MKNAFLLLLVLGAQLCFGQITLVQDDFPKAGDTPTYSVGDTLTGIDLTQTGANFTWDFSTLSPIRQRSDSFLSRNDLPFTLRFSIPRRVNSVSYINTPDSIPGAGVSLSGGFNLFAISAGAYENIGQATVIAGLLPVVLEKSPADTIFALPLNYQDAGGGFSFADVDLNIPTIGQVYYEQSRDRSYTVDGWGQLITPYGQFQVLRTRTAVSGSDSTELNLGGTPTAFRIPVPEQISYEWWGKGERTPLLRITAAQLGQNEIVTLVEYRDSVRQLNPTSVDREFEQVSLTLSPNPTTDVLNIEWDHRGKAGYLEIFDLNGKAVYAELIREPEVSISLQEIPAGTYVARLLELGGSRVFLGKVMKK